MNGQSEFDTNITYYLSQEEADNSENPLDPDFTNFENPQTIYVRLENLQSEQCYTTTNFDLIIKKSLYIPQ